MQPSNYAYAETSIVQIVYDPTPFSREYYLRTLIQSIRKLYVGNVGDYKFNFHLENGSVITFWYTIHALSFNLSSTYFQVQISKVANILRARKKQAKIWQNFESWQLYIYSSFQHCIVSIIYTVYDEKHQKRNRRYNFSCHMNHKNQSREFLSTTSTKKSIVKYRKVDHFLVLNLNLITPSAINNWNGRRTVLQLTKGCIKEQVKTAQKWI